MPSGRPSRSASSRLREAAVVGELDRLALVGRELAQRLLDDLALRAQPRLLVGRLAGRLRRRRRAARRGGAPRGGRGRPRGGGRASGSTCSACRARRGTCRPSARRRGTPPARRPRRARGRARSAARARRRPGRSGRRARRAPPRRRARRARAAPRPRGGRASPGRPAPGSSPRMKSRHVRHGAYAVSASNRSGPVGRASRRRARARRRRRARAGRGRVARRSEPRNEARGLHAAAGDDPDLVDLARRARREPADDEHGLARRLTSSVALRPLRRVRSAPTAERCVSPRLRARSQSAQRRRRPPRAASSRECRRRCERDHRRADVEHAQPRSRPRRGQLARERERGRGEAERLELLLAAPGRAAGGARTPAPRRASSASSAKAAAWSCTIRKYGASSSAPSAYQTPNSEAGGAERGRDPVERRARAAALESVSPKPVESSAIETAVNRAKSASATTATPRSWIAASRRTPTPALPPIPCTSPIPNACSGSGPTECAVGLRVVVEVGAARRVAWRAGGRPAPPADEQPDARAPTITSPIVTSAPCWTRSGRYALKSTIGRPNAKSEVAWPEPPGEAEPGGAPRRALAAEAISVVTAARWSGSVAWRRPSRIATPHDDEQRRPVREVRDPVVEAEHQLRRLSGGRARSSPGRGRGRRAR